MFLIETSHFMRNAINNRTFLKFAACAMISMAPGAAFAKLSGDLELQYYNTNTHYDTGSKDRAASFTQRYSLIYDQKGRILDGRFGRYDVAVGYEWTAVNATVDSSDASGATIQKSEYDATRGHILYRGEVVIDPREVPLKFKAYSRDMNRHMFMSSSGAFSGSGYASLVPTSISDGTHIESGANLVMGVKNGMTNGYSEVLRHLPMLYLDYTDFINRDLHNQNPVDNRLSRLAFVSLNKKDNWFHYRLIRYNDYIDPHNNYTESQIQLGTIDHLMQRQWIDFTNWLSVSADGQLTRHENSYNYALSSGSNQYDEFALNLFGIARRSNWEGRSLNNFSRLSQEDGRIIYRTSIPVHVSYQHSQDTSVNTRFAYNNNQTNQNEYYTDLSGGYRLETFKRSKFILNHQANISRIFSQSSNALIVSGDVETTSTPGYSKNLSFGASYGIRYSITDRVGQSSDHLENSLSLNGSYIYSDKLRLTMRQQNRLARGTSQDMASTIQGTMTTGLSGVTSSSNFLSTNTSSYQSISEFSAVWNPLPRLNVNVSAIEDIYKSNESPTSCVTSLSTTIDYSTDALQLSSTNSSAFGTDRLNGGKSTRFSSANQARYTFNRNLDSQLRFQFMHDENSARSTESITLDQSLTYNVYKTNGITRKLLQISEQFAYEDTIADSTGSDVRNRKSLTLSASYYPIRQLTLSAGSNYTFYSSFDNHEITMSTSVGMNFSLFQASLDYSIRRAQYSVNDPLRKYDGLLEKRFSANVRKSF